jgi:hypothetical protein
MDDREIDQASKGENVTSDRDCRPTTTTKTHPPTLATYE